MKARDENSTQSKYKGPHIILKCGFANVMNGPVFEDDTEKQYKMKKSVLNHIKSERKKIRGLHRSTLSNKYDADTTDVSWLCVFCKKGPHKCGLGDLFGPYMIGTGCDDNEKSQYKALVKNKYSIVQHENVQSKKTLEVFPGMVKLSDTSFEIWTHEDCFIWTSGTYLLGANFIGLEAAVWNSTNSMCSSCLMFGATISCIKRGCKLTSHLVCAKFGRWQLIESEFKALCPDHANQNEAQNLQ